MKFKLVRHFTQQLILIALLCSCNTEYFNSIPDARVNFKVYPYDIDPKLLPVTGSSTYTVARTAGERVGYGGLLVYHGSESSTDVYYAFDLSCPYEAKVDIRVVVENTLFARCPICKSKYEIFSGIGNPVEGPSKYPLKRYTGVNISNNVVTIYN